MASRLRRAVAILCVLIAVVAGPAGASPPGADARIPVRSAGGHAAGSRAATSVLVLVRFRSDAGRASRAEAIRTAGGDPAGTIHGLPVSVVRIPAGASVRAAAARLAASPAVAWAEPDGRVHAADAPVPDDPSFPQQYLLHNTGQTGGIPDADIDAPEGWSAAGLSPSWPGTGGTPIGFVDTGIDTAHPEFAGRIAACAHSLDGLGTPSGGCPDGNGHGTHVAGIAAAAADNGQGVAGVSFDSPVLECQALDATGSGFESDVAGCVTWLRDRGARVISMSLVGDATRAEHLAVQDAWDGGAGALLVAAAGNTGTTGLQYPAGYAEVVSVGNTTSRDVIHPTSTHNADVELSAPGTSILSTTRNGGYATLTGTSMSAPVVAGVAAVVWQLHPGDTAAQVRGVVDGAVDDLGAPGRDPSYGFGRIDLCDAVGASCPYQGSPPPQDGAISGTVLSTAGLPLRARVRVVSGPDAGATRAASSGAYTLPGLTPGAYTVRARKRGCAAQAKPVTVPAGATSTLNFRLSCPS